MLTVADEGVNETDTASDSGGSSLGDSVVAHEDTSGAVDGVYR